MPGLTFSPMNSSHKGSQSSSSSSRSQSPKERTNTLVVASLPTPFFHPAVLRVLRDYFLRFGDLHAFAPIPSFRRIIIVFLDDEAAEEAKLSMNGMRLGGEEENVILKVYRGSPTRIPNPDEDDSIHHLAPPALEKNFLISPPGSPPEGWEQIQEDPPNEAPLADDLVAALRRLQEEQDLRGGGGVRKTEDGRGEILWYASETPAGVGVCVESCDDDEDNSVEDVEEPKWTYGMDADADLIPALKTTSIPKPTSLPPKVPFPRTALPPRI